MSRSVNEKTETPQQQTVADSPTARHLAKALRATNKTQREIARDAGLPHANSLSMMKQGQMKLPLERIPALARACSADPRRFLRVAMAEYQPELLQTLQASFGDVLTPVEQDVLAMLRWCDPEGELQLDEEAVNVIGTLFTELVERRNEESGKQGPG